jgi:hypothetical protein
MPAHQGRECRFVALRDETPQQLPVRQPAAAHKSSPAKVRDDAAQRTGRHVDLSVARQRFSSLYREKRGLRVDLFSG